MGRKVVTVEPFIENIYRIHKAAVLENLVDNIVLIQNAVSDKRNEVKLLQENSKNIGGQGLSKNIILNKNEMKENKYAVETIIFDDLIDYLPKNEHGKDFKKAILKIDIEGFEPYAFSNATKLFNLIDFQIIFMEVIKLFLL